MTYKWAVRIQSCRRQGWALSWEQFHYITVTHYCFPPLKYFIFQVSTENQNVVSSCWKPECLSWQTPRSLTNMDSSAPTPTFHFFVKKPFFILKKMDQFCLVWAQCGLVGRSLGTNALAQVSVVKQEDLPSEGVGVGRGAEVLLLFF